MLTSERLESKVMNLYSKHINHQDNKHHLRAFVYGLRYKRAFRKYIKYLILSYKEEKINE